MDNNDLMRRIRYAVQLDDADAARLVALGGLAAAAEEIAGWRTREDEPGYVPCSDEALSALLDGFVLERRGPRPGPPRESPPDPVRAGRVTNNQVLKQLRIALELQATDVQALVVAGGGRLGGGELGALFRKPGTRNYRSCGDQVLRWFLSGLGTRRDA